MDTADFERICIIPHEALDILAQHPGWRGEYGPGWLVGYEVEGKPNAFDVELAPAMPGPRRVEILRRISLLSLYADTDYESLNRESDDADAPFVFRFRVPRMPRASRLWLNKPSGNVYRGVRREDGSTSAQLQSLEIRHAWLPLPRSSLAMHKLGYKPGANNYTWGYGGAGPHATAHAILANEYGEGWAFLGYRAFCHDIVADFPQRAEQYGEEWQLTSREINAWARLRLVPLREKIDRFLDGEGQSETVNLLHPAVLDIGPIDAPAFDLDTPEGRNELESWLGLTLTDEMLNTSAPVLRGMLDFLRQSEPPSGPRFLPQIETRGEGPILIGEDNSGTVSPDVLEAWRRRLGTIAGDQPADQTDDQRSTE